MLKESIKAHIHWMIRRDFQEVLEIEDACFSWEGWRDEFILRLLRQRNCIGMVAEYKERVVGYFIYELHRTYLHLLRIAVHPDFQRMGVGDQIVAKMKNKLGGHRRFAITVNIPDDWLEAQLFFRSMGFKCVDTDRGGGPEDQDMYMMVYEIPGAPPPEKELDEGRAAL